METNESVFETIDISSDESMAEDNDFDDADDSDGDVFDYYDQINDSDDPIIPRTPQSLPPSMPLPVVQLLSTVFYCNDLKSIRMTSNSVSLSKIFEHFYNSNAINDSDINEVSETKMLSDVMLANYRSQSKISAEVEAIKHLNLIYKRYEELRENANQMCGLFPNAHSLESDLKCGLTLLDDSRPEYHILNMYVTNGDHKFEVRYMFEVDRLGERERFAPYAHIRRKLLFHGTPVYNCYGILRNGLRLSGGHIFFADMPQKSYNFCGVDRMVVTDGYVMMFVVDVALGELVNVTNQYNYITANYSHSSKYNGRFVRNENSFGVIDNAIVLFGEPIDRNLNQSKTNFYYPYNEYLISNESQAKLRYLLVLKKVT